MQTAKDMSKKSHELFDMEASKNTLMLREKSWATAKAKIPAVSSARALGLQMWPGKQATASTGDESSADDTAFDIAKLGLSEQPTD
jgi:hypothetical protein